MFFVNMAAYGQEFSLLAPDVVDAVPTVYVTAVFSGMPHFSDPSVIGAEWGRRYFTAGVHPHF
jgi:hypothetical protein